MYLRILVIYMYVYACYLCIHACIGFYTFKFNAMQFQLVHIHHAQNDYDCEIYFYFLLALHFTFGCSS